MKKRSASALASLLATWFLGAPSTQAQPVMNLDPDTPINDYVSLGEFEETGVNPGWNSAGGGANPRLAVANGVLTITTTSGDPWFFRAGLRDIPANFTTVEVRLRKTAGSSSGWEMFYGFAEAGQGGFSGARRLGYDIPDDNEFHILHFDMSPVLNGAALTDFRIDPGQGAGNIAEVDYIRVGAVSPDTDNDGLPDSVETKTGVFAGPRDTGTDPAKADTDGDKVSDGVEVAFGSDPNNAADFPVPSIRYQISEAVYVVTEAIAPNNARLNNGVATSFTIAPALPAGLSFNTSDATISGTPTAPAAAADYLITANLQGGGAATASVRIEVRGPYISFPVDRFSFKPEQLIAPIAPVVRGPAPKSFQITPALPEGLALESTTGEISGAAAAYSPPRVYTLAASYDGHPNSVAEITIAILPDPVVTMDPADPLLSFYSFGEFDDEADAAALSIRNGIAPLTVANGALRVQTTGGDPFFGKAFNAERDFRIMEWRMKVIAGTPAPLRLYWAEDADGRRNLSELTAFSLTDINADGEFHVYRVDFGNSVAGRINVMRLDPGDGPGSELEVDYIRFGGFDVAITAAIQADGRIRVSWPASVSGYTLQSSQTLPGPWTADTSAVATEGNQNYILAQPTPGARFYRLIK